jgi:hypothetical protein
MKTGLASGCVAWLVLFSFISACLIPVGMMSAGITSSSSFVIETVGGYLCPAGTTPREYTYETTIWDSDLQTSVPATAYELICVDASGETVVNLGPSYAFIWAGVLGAAGTVVAAIVSIFLAGPIGMFIGKRFGRKQESAIGGQ